ITADNVKGLCRPIRPTLRRKPPLPIVETEPIINIIHVQRERRFLDHVLADDATVLALDVVQQIASLRRRSGAANGHIDVRQHVYQHLEVIVAEWSSEMILSHRVCLSLYQRPTPSR